MRVIVVEHDPCWAAKFENEAEFIRESLGDVVVAVEHIGSTAIPGIHAKPIIDILLEVRDLSTLDECASALTSVGYEAMGEFGIAGRRFFRKSSSEGVRTHHIHAFNCRSRDCERHRAFRDYLLAHPAVAQTYSALKRRLAEAHPDDIEAYMDGKDPFIREHEARALVWRESNPFDASTPHADSPQS